MEVKARMIESDAAVIVPVNPRADLEADSLSPFPTKRTADIGYHVRHLKRNGGVIWHIRRRVPLIPVSRGYFYESQKGVTHSFVIREWLDYYKKPIEARYEQYLTPERKREYDEDTSPRFRKWNPTAKFIGILIDEIKEIDKPWPLQRFVKISDGQPPRSVMSYPLVKYNVLPCHPAEFDINTIIHKTICNFVNREELLEGLLLLALEEQDPSLTLARQVKLPTGRLDVVEMQRGSKVKVFEVKAPNVAVRGKDVDQLEKYMNDLKKEHDDVEGIMVIESANEELRQFLKKRPDVKAIEYRFEVDFRSMTR